MQADPAVAAGASTAAAAGTSTAAAAGTSTAAAPVLSPVLSPLELFVTTRQAFFELPEDHVRGVQDFFRQVRDFVAGGGRTASGRCLRLSSNFDSVTAPGCNDLQKRRTAPGAVPNPVLLAGRRRRNRQGDGTCFNSAVEPLLELADAPELKPYQAKYFPATGQIQVPGGVRDDHADTRRAVDVWRETLVAAGAIAALPPIARETVLMRNYKCCLALPAAASGAPTVLAMNALSRLLYSFVDTAPAARAAAWLDRGAPRAFEVAVVAVKPANSSAKCAATFLNLREPDETLTANIFQRGKVNLLGAKTTEFAHEVHAVLAWLLEDGRRRLVVSQTPVDDEFLEVPPAVLRRALRARLVRTPAAGPAAADAAAADAAAADAAAADAAADADAAAANASLR